MIAFENEELLIQMMKIFLYVIFGLDLSHEVPLPLINFFDWLGSRRGPGSSFCILSSFLFLPLGVSCILPVCFGLTFRCLFLLIYKFFCVYL